MLRLTDLGYLKTVEFFTRWDSTNNTWATHSSAFGERVICTDDTPEKSLRHMVNTVKQEIRAKRFPA